MRNTFDLTRAADSIEAAGTDKNFVLSVRKFEAVSSVKLDLIDTNTSILQLHELSSKGETGSRHLAGALQVHAIITYARASHSKAISRFNVGVTGAYDSSQQEMHRRVIALRDKCIAHFGLGDGWNDERAIFKDEEATYGVTSVHMRSAFNLELLNDMDSLLSVAIPHVEKLERARADELMKSVFATSEANRAIIGENGFDITAFFQNLPDKEAEFWRARASMIVTS